MKKDEKKNNAISDAIVNEYWQDVEDKSLDEEYLKNEFHNHDSDFQIGGVRKSRRSFLKIMGFSFTAMPMVSCMRIPVKKALPYLEKTDKVIPGVANWYAVSPSPLFGSSLLVKTREGRPIKIEGNPQHPLSLGATLPKDQASLLSLYNSHRFKGPRIDGGNVEWSSIDKKMIEIFNKSQRDGKEIVLISNPQSSPSSLKLIAQIKKKYSNFKHVTYAPFFQHSIIEAVEKNFGVRSLPTFNFDKANVVVSFSADFLGTWIAPATFTKQYSQSRDLLSGKTMLKHIQFESLMSLTGTNADERFTVSAQEESALIINILAYIQKKLGLSYLPAMQRLPSTNNELVAKVSEQLLSNIGKSLVVSGSDNVAIQVLINSINHALGNFNNTVSIYKNDHFLSSPEEEFRRILDDGAKGKIGAILFWNSNPVYDYSDRDKIAAAFEKIETKISFSSAPDETSEFCNIIAPENHFLESWCDYVQAPNLVSFSQPVIQPLYGSRMVQETFVKILNLSGDFYDYIRVNHEESFFSKQSKNVLFDSYWNEGVHNGVVLIEGVCEIVNSFDKAKIPWAFSIANKIIDPNEGFLLKLYEKVGIGAGGMTDNPWLQELPDPVTKATWDNYLMIAPKVAKKMSLKTGDIVELSGARSSVEVPVLLQPGTAQNVLALAVGYGRTVTGKAGLNVGVNAYPLMNDSGKVTIKKTGKRRVIAQTQTHHSMEGRDIIRETTLESWKHDPKSGQKASIDLISMWSKHDKSGQQWAMAIDLTKCTGCSGCVVSCHSENNVPVVGREEVLNRRDMHWMRIDRYYKGSDENPEVMHQPVMCQHCDNAPCETVCPVLATVQSSDGLNQQVYNRCVGTRYCANNCPYKVRRFNWFDYPHTDMNENMALNPDVAVRSRGVMEKCSMCIQRIQEGKLEAKKNEDKFSADNVKLACQQSCPADAIVFGDLNDKEGRLYKLLHDPRNYRLLEELNVQPRVNYLVKVRNKG